MENRDEGRASLLPNLYNTTTSAAKWSNALNTGVYPITFSNEEPVSKRYGGMVSSKDGK